MFSPSSEAKHLGVYRLSDDERAAVREGLAQAARGEFVPDDAVEAYFQKYRRHARHSGPVSPARA